MTLLLLACTTESLDPPGGQSGEEDFGCLPQGSTPVGLDEVSPLGVSPAELLAVAEGRHLAGLSWAAGGETELELDVDPGAAIAWVDYEYESDGSMAIEIGCADALEIDADLGFVTADGGFAEAFATTLQAVDATGLSWSASLGLDDVAGSYDAAEIDQERYNDGVDLHFSGSFTEAGSSGTVDGQGMGHEGEGDDGIAFAEAFEVASW